MFRLESRFGTDCKSAPAGVFDYSGNNQVNISQLNPFKAESSTSTEAVVEAKGTFSVSGVPVNVSNSQSIGTNGERSSTSQIGVGISSSNVDANASIKIKTSTKSDGTTTSNVAAGTYVNTTVKNEQNTKTQFGVFFEVQTQIPYR